nr:hypothetical protein GCM10020092_033610 [Actinoplanes digitatis]
MDPGSAAAARATDGSCVQRTTSSFTSPAAATVARLGTHAGPVEEVVRLGLHLVPDADEQVAAGAGTVAGDRRGQVRIL